MYRIGLALIGVAATGIQMAGAAEVTLKAAAFLPRRAAVAVPFHRWVKEVNKRCVGKVKITVVGPAAIGSLQQWSAVKSGVVDMHYGPANYFKGVMPEAAVTDVAQNSSAAQRRNGALKLLNEVYHKKMNAHLLTVMTNGLRFYIFTNKPAKNGRFEGLRLRSVPIYDAFFRHLGAQTVRMAPPAVYTGLERGTVDGYGWPNWGVTVFGWQKFTKYQYGPGFLNGGVHLMVNLDRWKSLTGVQRQCLEQMTLWFESVWPKWKAEGDRKANAALRKAGVRYIDLGPAFAQKAFDLNWAEIEKVNPDFVRKIKPLMTK